MNKRSNFLIHKTLNDDFYPTTNNYTKMQVTTNLNAHELEDRYGNHIRFRMWELFKLIAFYKENKNKRK